VNSAPSAPLPAGYVSRSASLEDIDVLAAVWARNDTHYGLRPQSAVSFLSWVLPLPYVSLERDTVIVEQANVPAAFAISSRDPSSVGSAFHWSGVVDPAHLGRGLGGWLLRWATVGAEARRTTEGTFDVRSVVPAPDESGCALLAASGFEPVRTMWDMRRDLRDAEIDRSLPEGLALRTFETDRDERTFWEVAETSFEEHFGHAPTPFATWEQEWYASSDWVPSRVLLAEHDGEVVGELAWVDADPDGYIVSLGVLEEHRGRGIAKALLRRAFADIAAAGFAEATLTVDAANVTGAVGLYRSVGMEEVREYVVFQLVGA
jgi:mycothiol synthase